MRSVGGGRKPAAMFWLMIAGRLADWSGSRDRAGKLDDRRLE
jgi:hypothetical protein